MTDFKVKKGLDLPLTGRAEAAVAELPFPKRAAVYPSEYPELKPRMQVEVGDEVKRGSVLLSCKRREGFQYCSPVAGRVSEINLGARRSIREIVIETDPENAAVEFRKYGPDEISRIDRQEAMEALLSSGMLALIQQRPFSHIASASAEPKSIFVNAMHSAPFGADIELVLAGREREFQAGLDFLTCLTDGKVYLNIASSAKSDLLRGAANVEVNSFSGPHPSGNSSVHIANLDPIVPGDAVWVVKALDLLLIGEMLLAGELPARRTIAVGGPGVAPEARKHYEIVRGGWLEDWLKPVLRFEDARVISGDILMGEQVAPASGLRQRADALTVLKEERESRFLGWLAPGLDVFSVSRLFLSKWLRPHAEWPLTTADHGGRRAMFATGIYDRYMPLDIMVDFLLRAVIAHDTEESVQLGILETDPEDFALCSYACPSRTDVVGLIREGLEEIEAEGIYTREQE